MGLPLAIIPLAMVIGILLILDLGRSSIAEAKRAQDQIFRQKAQDILEKVQEHERQEAQARAEIASLEAQLAERTEQLSKAYPYQQRVDALVAATEKMKTVWRDRNFSEHQCVELIKENPWVLWPDYVFTDDLHVERNLKNAVNLLFKNEDPPQSAKYLNLPTDAALRPDAFGWAKVKSSIQPAYNDQDGNVLLIIEFKRSDVTINEQHMQQAYTYATGIMAKAANHLWGQPIDCLVIGGKINPDIGDYHLRFGKEPHQSVRVIPMTYDTLISRAETLVERLVYGG